LPTDDAERLLGSLDEEYADFQHDVRGSRAASRWYWRQALQSIWVLRKARVASALGHRRGGGRGGVGIDSVTRELRHALRGLRGAPTYTATATLTLALGIGATTAIFSVVHSVLLRSLPYEAPARIIRAWDNTDDGEVTEFSFRVVEYRELRTRSGVFEAVGAEFPISATVLVAGREPRQIQGRMVTSDLFEVFGVAPVLGRMFTEEEVAAGDRMLAVVTHGFWTRYLGADPGAVGTTLDVDGRSYSLLGVLPAGYRHVSGVDAELFVPYTIGTRGWIGHWLDLYGLLEQGVSHRRAAEEIDSALAAVADTDRQGDRWYATVESLRDMVVGDVRPALWALFAAIGLVLLLACVNVANVTLARSTSRSEEIALRKALGASSPTLVRQLLLESLVVAGGGGVLGVLGAWGSLRALLRLAPPSIPRIQDTELDAVVLGFSLLVSLATMLAFGLGPAIRSVREGASVSGLSGSRGDTGGRRFHRLLGGLVVSQVALTLTLLASTGLAVRTLQHLQRTDLGFDRANALTFRVGVPSSRYPTGGETHAFYERLREAIGALPGVLAVGAGTDLPVSGSGAMATVTSRERLERGVEEGVTVLQRRATEGLFEALGTSILAGRGFDVRDRGDGEHAAVVSASLARALFGSEPAVGRRIGWGSVPEEGDWMTVVGVVADVTYEGLESTRAAQIYQAHAQSSSREMAVVVRTERDPMSTLEGARAALHALDPDVPVYSVGTLGGLVDGALAGRRFTTTLVGLFAFVALALTVAGLYGVLAFAVGRRRREMGVRMALGADRRAVVGLVLRRGLALVAAGLAVGFLGALWVGRLLQGMLVGVAPFDPLTLVIASVALVAVATVACLAPAIGAARVDPVETLSRR
jgi:predicted permease